jgi:hypothetical protein
MILCADGGRTIERRKGLRTTATTEMKASIAYIGIAFALSIGLSLLIGLTGGVDSRLFGLAYLSMFLPAIAVGIVIRAMKEAPLIAWHRFPLSYLPVALFLMPTVLHLTMLPTMAFIESGLQWQDWLRPQSDGLYHAPPSSGWRY